MNGSRTLNSCLVGREIDLKTAQVYLGEVGQSEAIRWMDILHGKQAKYINFPVERQSLGAAY